MPWARLFRGTSPTRRPTMPSWRSRLCGTATIRGNNVNAAPQDPSDLDFLFDNKTQHLHSTSPQFFSTVHGQMLVCWGENGQCRVWTMQPNGHMTFLADSDEVASANSTNSPGGMPGCF